MKQLDLQDGIRSTVYTAIVLQLKNDPALEPIVQTWTTYCGDEEDDEAPAGEDSLPSIEILPFGLGASPASLVTQEAPMGISISVATDGLDVRDLLNLWEAVEGAMFKGDGHATLLTQLKTALAAMPAPNGQISTIRLTAPAITARQADIDNQMMVAAGTLLVELRIPK